MFIDSVESQYFVGAGSRLGHSIRSHSSGSFGVQPSPRARTRTHAKRERKGSAEPSRHVIVCHARLGSPSANVWAVILPWPPLPASTSVLAGTAAE